MVYLSFFAILFRFYGLPIHILRDVVVTMRSFARRIIDFIRYRNATRDMNQRYPDATAEEIAREDVCIICREEMQPWIPVPAANDGAGLARPTRAIPERLRAKKLPCGHLLHFACLRSWLERQQNCPTCRQPVSTGTQGNTRPFAGRGAAAAGGQRGGDQQEGGNEAGAADGENRRRMWFLNFGPVRIGFGAGRGDLLQNIDMGQGVHGQAAQAPAANQNQNLPAGGQAPRIGFGFGIDRPIAGNTPSSTAEFNHRDVQQITQQLERQVFQEINNLTNTAEQLQVIRALHNELTRLRSVQGNAGPSNQSAANPGFSRTQPNTTQAHPLTARTIPPGTNSLATTSQSHSLQYTATNPHLTSIPSGDPRLPEGFSIPPGWTLVPLQRTVPLNSSTVPHNTAGGSTGTNIPTTTSPLSSSAPGSASTPSFMNHNPTTATATLPTAAPSQERSNNGISNASSSSPLESFRSGITQQQSSQHTPTIATPQDTTTNNTAPASSLPSTSPQPELHGLSSHGASQSPGGPEENRSLFNNPLAPSFPEHGEHGRERDESEEENGDENNEDENEESESDENDSEEASSTHSSASKHKGRAATVEDEAEDG